MHWQQVRKILKAKPIAEGRIEGSVPLYAERFLLKSIERSVPGLDVTALVTLLGGSRVQEGKPGRAQGSVLPSQSMLVPAGCDTLWRYSGAVDFIVFYFTDRTARMQQRVRAVAQGNGQPRLLSDALVSATALQIAAELQKGAVADKRYIALLARVMLEQAFRALGNAAPRGIDPRHVHFARLQAVLAHVHEHLGEDLSVAILARQARVSEAHFRRLFEQAAGTSPHRYVLAARLEQARRLLAVQSMPISRIAQECGFSSQSHLTERFRASYGATPGEYRDQVRHRSIRAAPRGKHPARHSRQRATSHRRSKVSAAP